MWQTFCGGVSGGFEKAVNGRWRGIDKVGEKIVGGKDGKEYI